MYAAEAARESDEPAERQATGDTHRRIVSGGLGHPAHRIACAESSTLRRSSAPQTSVRRCAANVST